MAESREDFIKMRTALRPTSLVLQICALATMACGGGHLNEGPQDVGGPPSPGPSNPQPPNNPNNPPNNSNNCPDPALTALPQHYSIQLLDSLPGVHNSLVNNVLPSGNPLAVGEVQTLGGSQGVTITAVVFGANGTTSLLDGASAAAANSNGQIVGSIFSGTTQQAFLFKDNSATPLPMPSGTSSSLATGINASGDVVGWLQTSNFEDHAFLFHQGVMSDLGTFGGFHAWTSQISDSGKIVAYNLDKTFGYTSFVYDISTQTAVTLPTLSQDSRISIATAMSPCGDLVTGYASTEAGSVANIHGFIVRLSNNTITDLGMPPSGDFAMSLSVNDLGQAAGSYVNYFGSHAAFVYGVDPEDSTGARKMFDLKSLLVDSSEWLILTEARFGKDGVLIGTGITAEGSDRAFIATPTSTSPASQTSSLAR